METIKMYLENMFMSLPKTREVLRAKEELLAMMEDKYSELIAGGKTDNEAVGIVITEFGNLQEISSELGISSVVEKKGTEEDFQAAGEEQRFVSFDLAQSFLEQNRKGGNWIGVGVLLCIWSVIPVILLDGAAHISGYLGFGEAVGVTIMFLAIAAAVGLFIYHGMQFEKYGYLKKERLWMDAGTENYLRERKDSLRPAFAIAVTAGVLLCMMSVVPSVIAGSVFKSSFLENAAAAALFFMVGIGVFLFISFGVRYGAYSVLLQEEEYAVKEKEKKLTGIVASVYWPLTTCIYLAWSFLTWEWHRTWIIWPVAGVLFGAIAAVCSAVEDRRKVC